MAEPRKVPFVTLSAPSPGSEVRKRRLDTKLSASREQELGDPEAAATSKSPRHHETARINITLTESTGQSYPEFSYSKLLQAQKRPPAVTQTHHPFNDQQHTQEVEALARKFENRYRSGRRRKHEDRLQDLIDIGFGYDDSDSFIDNSEAYDELVPASLTTKLGAFYINTESNCVQRPETGRGSEESEVKKRRRDEEESEKNNQLTPTGTCRPQKKTRKLMLASMLKCFTRENVRNNALLGDLTSDPAMMSLLTSANESELQDLLNELDFGALDPDPQMKTGLMWACVTQGAELVSPPPLPDGLPAPLIKRIEDLRAASRQFDEEGRKKFFTLDMNNILLDIELQVQEQSPSVGAAVYSHLEAFVPCNKETLLKRLKKLSLSIQDDRLRTPLLKLKLAVCSVMPEQTARYNRDCMAKVAAKRLMEDGEGNGSDDDDDDDDEKPGRRVIVPRKKFMWDDKLRTLLCNIVRVKLRCYEQEMSSLSVEDYLKAFMENEVKPLWPKGWMQARKLLKESHTVHGHLTELVKKRISCTPKPAKIKDLGWRIGAVAGISPAPFPPEPICLSDSLDDDLADSSVDSITQTLTLLNSSTNGVNFDCAPSTSSSCPVAAKPHPHTASSAPSSQSSLLKDVSSVQRQTHTPASKPINTSTTTTPAAKPRPPPTTSLLHKPLGAKSGQAPPTLIKPCDVQQPALNSFNPKSLQQLATPPLSSLPLIQKKTTPTLPHQQRFITPMQATITKSSQSSNSPIIKLTIRPSAQTTPIGPSHRPSAQTTLIGPSHRPSAQTTLIGPSHRPSAQTTPIGPSHRPSAQTTPIGPSHRPSAQTTPIGPSHRPSAQTTPIGPSHRPSAQTTPIGPSHRPSSQTTPTGPSNHPSTQATPTGPSHRPSAQPTPTGFTHCSSAQSTPPAPVRQPPGSTHLSSVSTPSPPSTTHQPAIATPPSGHGNRPPASDFQNISAHRSPVSTRSASGSTHRPLVSTPPSPRSSAQPSPSSAYRPSVSTPPPTHARRSPVATPPSVSSPAPTPPTPYNPKSSGFTPPFSPAPVATPLTSSFQDLTSLSVAANHGQRQRAVGGANRSNISSANCASTMGLPSLSDSALLNQVSSVPLGLGMFRGFVPVSLPFRFPLLNFTPPGAATPPPSSGYTLTPNLFKNLQSGVAAALPPHLQLAFSESNQSQDRDKKRK